MNKQDLQREIDARWNRGKAQREIQKIEEAERKKLTWMDMSAQDSEENVESSEEKRSNRRRRKKRKRNREPTEKTQETRQQVWTPSNGGS